MARIMYANEAHPWHSPLSTWADQIMRCINPLSEGVPNAWAQIIEKKGQIQFELRVEWYDSLLHEVLVETFTHEPDKEVNTGLG